MTANPKKRDYEPPALTVELHPRNSVVMAAAVSESGKILRFPIDTRLDTKLTPRQVARMKEGFRVTVDKHGMRGTVFWRRDAWWLRFTVAGKLRRLALKTTDAKVAKSKAIDMLTVAGRDGVAKLAAAAGCKDMTPTIGAMTDHYLAKTLSRTAKRNVLCLYRVIACGHGWHPDGRVMAAEVRERVRALRTSALTEDVVAAYYRHDSVVQYTRRTTLAGAKAIFAHKIDWVGYALPDMAKFIAASGGVAPEYNANRFISIPKDALAAMEKDSHADPMIRKAFIMCRYLGMTPKEVAFSRYTWMPEVGGKCIMQIREREREEGFTLKTGNTRQRDIELSPWMAAELTAKPAGVPDSEFLVALPTENLRYQWMLRTFNFWVRRYIPGRKGAAYELRKQAGTDWLLATGRISEVQKLLGHSTPTTTSRWYVDDNVIVPSVFQEKPTQ